MRTQIQVRLFVAQKSELVAIAILRGAVQLEKKHNRRIVGQR